MDSSRHYQIATVIDEGVHDRLAAAAKKQDRSMNQCMRIAVKEYLARYEAATSETESE
jgi:predicted HicB family RNase H-like nuclease